MQHRRRVALGVALWWTASGIASSELDTFAGVVPRPAPNPRTGPRSLAIESLDGSMLDRFDTLFRDVDRGAHPFAVGDQVRDGGAVVRVGAVTNGKPSRLEVTFLEIGDPDDASGTDPISPLA